MNDLEHDFRIKRNHHGVGFWDRIYDNDDEGDLMEKLTKIVEKI
jgi:hypothetical protein